MGLHVIKSLVENIGTEATVRYNDCGGVVEFSVALICGHSQDGKPIYWREGELSFPNENVCYEIDCAETYLHGSVKWDGCSHYYFGNNDIKGYLHLCGGGDAAVLANAVTTIHKRCGQIMAESGQYILEDQFDLKKGEVDVNTK